MYYFIWTIRSAIVPLRRHGTPSPSLEIGYLFPVFPFSQPQPRDWLELHPNSTHGRKLWTSMTLSCLVRSLTQTHLAASPLPSVIDLHTTVYTQTHTHTLLGTQTLARIGCTEQLSGLQCSHACLLADRDKPLFHSLTHPHRYTHMQALGKPQWGDIKEHALLPVKLYCMQAHSHTMSTSTWTLPTLF